MSRNLLDQETSPYLLLHKDNPVHWRPWGPEALAEAEATGKPILLSIGYTACHWCHVMNHESFADPETAALMNDLCIPIKVDREERPDVDHVYQTAANALGQSGGWPLTAFLTPAGEPFAIGSYYPKEERYGRPSFKRVLEDVARVWRDQPEPVASTAASVRDAYNTLWGRNLSGAFEPMMLDITAVHVGQRFDMFYGGMSGPPKFPSTGLTELLWRAYLRSGTVQFDQLVQTTLFSECMGGMYDHIGGGFARYATDERWMIPHFEKMLYDNALLIDLLTLVWQGNRQALYRERIEETIAWVLRDMAVEHAFASSLDADSEGEEGKYYTWTESEIDAALAGTFAQRFKETYHVTREGAGQGRNILHRVGPNSRYPLAAADETLHKKQREMLLAVRNKRVPPARDDKVLADWNGMMIAALANAGVALRRMDWTASAIRAFDFVLNALGDGDRLYHSWRNGKRGHFGFADDYAHMARAALALWESTNDPAYLNKAKDWVRVLNEHFWDIQNGGYFQTSDDSDPLIVRPRAVFDQATPCANGTMVMVLGKLHYATADVAYRDRANALIQAFAGEIGRAYISMGSYMNGIEFVISGLQIVIVGSITNPKTHELVSAVTSRSLPNKTMILIDPGQSLPQGHPAFGKTMENGQPTAYVCQHQSCSFPITNPVTLSQTLQLPPRAARPQ
jgi:uncharacterized protein YyaL (SSP411 family)